MKIIYYIPIFLLIYCSDNNKQNLISPECHINERLYSNLRLEMNHGDSTTYNEFLNGEFHKISNDTALIKSDIAMGVKIISFLEIDSFNSAKLLLKPILEKVCFFSDTLRDYPRELFKRIPPFISYALFRYDHYLFERRDRLNDRLLGDLMYYSALDDKFNLLFSADRTRQINYNDVVYFKTYFDSIINLYPDFHYFKVLKFEAISYCGFDYLNKFLDTQDALDDIYKSGYRKKWCLNEKIMMYDFYEINDSLEKYEKIFFENYNKNAYRLKYYHISKEESLLQN